MVNDIPIQTWATVISECFGGMNTIEQRGQTILTFSCVNENIEANEIESILPTLYEITNDLFAQENFVTKI